MLLCFQLSVVGIRLLGVQWLWLNNNNNNNKITILEMTKNQFRKFYFQISYLNVY
uniref:Uncharacterized protein n=1 Tax=Anguilla anguilla TaxID=7936 RepID=A0A0E9XRH6_ANGAN